MRCAELLYWHVIYTSWGKLTSHVFLLHDRVLPCRLWNARQVYNVSMYDVQRFFFNTYLLRKHIRTRRSENLTASEWHNRSTRIESSLYDLRATARRRFHSHVLVDRYFMYMIRAHT